ncbi:hypothetical protein VCUG_01806 [Vavraia culicis subsp. floridensis]|uniref:Uncharacterized protein n=1 Tax=Vavraia culicis (isolate floridensis) TaxID=948595 RepID=L2GUD3_VAVCU|nr:uncharacterized protein VCUG_01806 [Vavraia culicis subsp. floridensis]ELA46720.1 hypothetical protein VCUG_01806 [Vavraia culicis subsp. floridensis]
MASRKKAFAKNERKGRYNGDKERSKNHKKDNKANHARMEHKNSGRIRNSDDKSSKFNKNDFKSAKNNVIGGRRKSEMKHNRDIGQNRRITDNKHERKAPVNAIDKRISENKRKREEEKQKKKQLKEGEQELENNSQLRKIYYMEENVDEVGKFVESATKDVIKEEISYLGYLVKQKEYDRSLCAFMVENISKCIGNNNLTSFLNIMFKLVEIISIKKSVYHLKIIQSILRIPFYIPLGLKLIELFKMGIAIKDTKAIGKKVDYSKVKLTTEYLKSEELKEFILEESLALLFAHLNSISDSLGFPEVSYHVLKELKEIKEDNIDLKDLIERIEGQVDVIKNKRKGIKFISEKDIREFELSTNKMVG